MATEILGVPDTPCCVNLELTRHCNLSCGYCTIRDNDSPSVTYFQPDHFIKIIDKLVQNRVFEVSFFGGEPFLYSDIYTLADYAKQCGLVVGLVSNGTLIQTKDIPRIKKSFDAVTIALNGLEKVHDRSVGKRGAFKHITRIVGELLDSGFRVGIDTLVSASTVSELQDFLTWTTDKLPSVNTIFINLFTSMNENNPQEQLSPNQVNDVLGIMDSFNKALNYNKVMLGNSIPFCAVPEAYKYLRKGCSAGWAFAGIDAFGNVRTCPWSTSILGNILVTELKEIWRDSDPIKKFRSLDWLPETSCKRCIFLNSCMGGCKINSASSHLEKERVPSLNPATSNESIWTDTVGNSQEPLNSIVYSLSSDLRIRDEESGSIIYLRGTGRYYWCNNSTREVLGMIEKGSDLGMMVQELFMSYDADLEEISKDVKQIAIFLEEIGAIHPLN